MSPSTRRFVRHYLEMVAAMIVGMVVLGGASALLLDLPDDAAVTLVEMAIAMTVPMVAWMRFRGHGWRACNEMAVAMLIPTVGALILLATGLAGDADTLIMVQHVAMFPSMLVAMLLRRDEYAGHHRGPSHETPARIPRPSGSRLRDNSTSFASAKGRNDASTHSTAHGRRPIV